MDAKSEERLLEAARKGDEAAFLLLFENHQETIFRFAYRMVGSEAVAQDLARECFLSLLQSRVRLNEGRKLCSACSAIEIVMKLSASLDFGI